MHNNKTKIRDSPRTYLAFGGCCFGCICIAAARLPIRFRPAAQAQNMKQIGFSALGGRFGGFKIAIKHTANDKWYLYTGHSFNQGWSIVDVTDPANPRYVKFIPYVTDDKSIITAQVTLHDNLMITSLNSFRPQKNPLPAVLLWDISDPENPKQVGSWKGGATGAHRNSYPGGKYAYLSTSYPGFKLHIMVILDVSDPAHPKEVGKWWQPGQKDGEPPVAISRKAFMGRSMSAPTARWRRSAIRPTWSISTFPIRPIRS